MQQRLIVMALGAMVVAGCPADEPKDDAAGDSETSTSLSTSSTTTSSDVTSSTASTSTSDGSGTTGSADGESTAATGGSGDTGATGTTGGVNDPRNPLDCSGKIYECGDGVDNDGDGHTDLQDPECTGPCDDDEGSFATGIPGDNSDCKQDCFFDGNSGQGNDGCIWDLKCDPQDPGANIGCAYTGGNNCDNMPPNQDPGCIMVCQQYVPPGCDCFGCCTVQTPDGPVDIFLNGDENCSLENIDSCTHCTSQIDDCGNPCEPEECEICFGETEPPEGCDMGVCDNELPCDVTADCPTDFFCYLGCCYPPPEG